MFTICNIGIDSGNRSIVLVSGPAVITVYHIVNKYCSLRPTSLWPETHLLRSHIWPMNSCFLGSTP